MAQMNNQKYGCRLTDKENTYSMEPEKSQRFYIFPVQGRFNVLNIKDNRHF
jgi:hypothetical protein